ncbi:hypothetical protein PL81_34970 [Streptomyces sp. RSD-27]|nr:hypothetical protein PL81_34970 [Streptomyces sp. RSD-27]
MSLDLSHGFFAEVQFDIRTVQQIFARHFLRRAGEVHLSPEIGRELSMWFDRPDLALTRHPDPAANRVEAPLRLIARLSDRSDEARVFVSARGTVETRTVEAGSCPVVDFRHSKKDDDFVQTFTDNPAYDDVVLPAVKGLLQQRSPFPLGPLAKGVGTPVYGTYFDVPNRTDGLLVMFLGGANAPPPKVTDQLFSNDVMLLVPDALVLAAIEKGKQQAGLGTLPAQLNPRVKVNTLATSLANGHILVEGSGTSTDKFIVVAIDTDFTFKVFVQPLVDPATHTVVINVLSTQQSIDGAGSDFLDAITGGLLTRALERILPNVIGGLTLGSFSGLDFFDGGASAEEESAPATPGFIPRVFSNGMGIPFDLHASVPDAARPPYMRGHTVSRQFHVPKGCRFGDLIRPRNLREFPSTNAALAAGYDGCAVCEPEFDVPEFSDLTVDVAHPPGVRPGAAVTVRATYADDLVRFGVPLAPEPQEEVSRTPGDGDGGVPTHHVSFGHLVPAEWTVSATAGDWSAETTVLLGTRVLHADGTVTGEETRLTATVGEPDLVKADG